jgi:hypothetical protein
MLHFGAVETGVADAGHLRFGRERHLDLVRPLGHVDRQLVAHLVVETEAPLAVQVGPVVAYQLGTWIFKLTHCFPFLQSD